MSADGSASRFFIPSIPLHLHIGFSYNGSTRDFGSCGIGSIPVRTTHSNRNIRHMQNVVEQIHTDFSFDLLEAVRGANEISLLQRIKPDMVPEPEFVDRVQYYRHRYPSYNFVTEKQIEEICLKYGLSFGSLMMFSGAIPVKNRLEISRFHLREPDDVHFDKGLPNQIYNLAVTNGVSAMVSTGTGWRGDRGWIEFRSGHQPADPEKPFMVVPVGEHFTLVQNPDGDTYRIYLELDVHGSPWMVEFGAVSYRSGGVTFEWRSSFRSGVSGRREIRFVENFADVRLRIPLEQVDRAKRLALTHNVSPMIVADSSMFNRFGDAVEKSGHRMKFKRSQLPAHVALHFVDDPIILQPVPYGYLVVTKWGAEARIGEIQNAASN